MTESTTWLSIVADDLIEIKGQIAAGNARWTDDDVLGRLLWDLSAGIVGLAQEMDREHKETVKIWGSVRHAGAQSRDQGGPRSEGARGVDRPAQVREDEVPGDGPGGPESEPVTTPYDTVQAITYTG
jgi:hypothetical protein